MNSFRQRFMLTIPIRLHLTLIFVGMTVFGVAFSRLLLACGVTDLLVRNLLVMPASYGGRPGSRGADADHALRC